MIILSNTTDKIQVKLGATVSSTQMKCISSYRDTTTSSISPLRNALSTNNITAVDLVGSPASSTQRIVDYISVYNSDSSSLLTTIQFSDNGTLYTLFESNLAKGEKIEYTEGSGFKTFDIGGSIKYNFSQGISPIGSSMSTVIISGDVTNNDVTANTMADVTGLSFAVTSGKSYWFRFSIRYTAAGNGTGSRWSINGPSTTYLAYYSVYSATIATFTLNHGINAYDTPAATNTSSPSTLEGESIIEGIIRPSANGTVIARFASEVSASAIIAKAGSFVQYTTVL